MALRVQAAESRGDARNICFERGNAGRGLGDFDSEVQRRHGAIDYQERGGRQKTRQGMPIRTGNEWRVTRRPWSTRARSATAAVCMSRQQRKTIRNGFPSDTADAAVAGSHGLLEPPLSVAPYIAQLYRHLQVRHLQVRQAAADNSLYLINKAMLTFQKDSVLLPAVSCKSWFIESSPQRLPARLLQLPSVDANSTNKCELASFRKPSPRHTYRYWHTTRRLAISTSPSRLMTASGVR